VHEALLQVQRVRRVVDLVAVPDRGERVGRERLGADRTVPGLDPLLVGPDIAQVLQPRGWAAHEAATLGPQHREHAPQHGRVE